MKKLKVWMNNRFVDMDDARVSIFDRGFLYGDGVFETMRSYAGIIFRLNEHLDRLFAALKIMGIRSPYSAGELERAICRILKMNGLESAYIRLSITRGEGRFGIGHKDRFVPNAVIAAKAFEDYPAWMYKRGISARIVDIRQNEYSPVTGIKSLNFLTRILARRCANEAGFDDAILTNTKGRVAEGATSNIFLVKKNSIVTPSLDSGILRGVTRGVIISIAGALKLDVEERHVSCEELLSSDEAFFTNSLAEVLPVKAVNSRKIGTGRPGETTRLLHISYRKQVIKELLSLVV